MAEHTHAWIETLIGCDDCGEHPALMCDTEDCPDDYDVNAIDLIREDDPRDA